MIEAANPSLKKSLTQHREETLEQLQRLETPLARHKAHAGEHTDQAMQRSCARPKRCWRCSMARTCATPG
jgi:ferritin-like metal-binding protein YciE